MIAYVDSSVLLRVLLGQKGQLKEFVKVTRPVSSLLLKTEILRTIDRLRTLNKLTNDQYAVAAAQAHESVHPIELIRVTDSILTRAGASFATPLGTLDAIHLVSALAWQSMHDERLTFLTHDHQLAQAAWASGFKVLGVPAPR